MSGGDIHVDGLPVGDFEIKKSVLTQRGQIVGASAAATPAAIPAPAGNNKLLISDYSQPSGWGTIDPPDLETTISHMFYRFHYDTRMRFSTAGYVFPGGHPGELRKVAIRGSASDVWQAGALKGSAAFEQEFTNDGSGNLLGDVFTTVDESSLVGRVANIAATSTNIILMASTYRRAATYVFGRTFTGSLTMRANSGGTAGAGFADHPVPGSGTLNSVSWRRELGDGGTIGVYVNGALAHSFVIRAGEQHGTHIWGGESLVSGDYFELRSTSGFASSAETVFVAGVDYGQDSEIFTFGGDTGTGAFYLFPFGNSSEIAAAASSQETRHPVPANYSLTDWAYYANSAGGSPVMGVYVNGILADSITYTTPRGQGAFTSPISLSAGDYLELRETGSSFNFCNFNLLGEYV